MERTSYETHALIKLAFPFFINAEVSSFASLSYAFLNAPVRSDVLTQHTGDAAWRPCCASGSAAETPDRTAPRTRSKNWSRREFLGCLQGSGLVCLFFFLSQIPLKETTSAHLTRFSAGASQHSCFHLSVTTIAYPHLSSRLGSAVDGPI